MIKNEENGKKMQYGRSMIEMLGVLAIIGVLSVGGIAGYSKAMHRYRVNKTIEQITYMAGAIRSFFAPQKSYDGLASGNASGRSLIKKAQLVPEEMWGNYSFDVGDGVIREGFGLTNPFGGNVDIVTSQRDASDIDKLKAFLFYYKSIPQEACIELVSQDWSAANVGVIYIYAYANGVGYVVPPVSLDKATSLCRSPQFNHIQFHFDIDVKDSFWQNKISATNTQFGW